MRSWISSLSSKKASLTPGLSYRVAVQNITRGSSSRKAQQSTARPLSLWTSSIAARYGATRYSSQGHSGQKLHTLHQTVDVPYDLANVSPVARNARNASEKFIACTIFDINGDVVAVSEKFPKAKFLVDNGLYPRDLRNIDNSPISIIPSILVRDSCILLNLLHIKAIIKADKVMVIDSFDQADSAKLSLLMYDLEAKLKSAGGHSYESAIPHAGQLPYEMRALESILINIVSTLDTELQSHLVVLHRILAELEDHVDRDILRELLIRNKSLSKFYQKSLLVRNVFNDVLDNDEDLVGMYLTEKKAARQNKLSVTRDLTDHDEAELLLESYYKQTDELVQQADQVLGNIKNTEDVINIILDANRNALMQLELKITITTLGFTVGAFFAALYGMNLKNFIEESDLGFGAVTISITTVAALITILNLRKLAKLRHITMGTDISPSTVEKHSHLQKRYKLHNPSNVHGWNWRHLWYHFRDKKRERLLTHQKLDPFSNTRRHVSWRWLVQDKGRP